MAAGAVVFGAVFVSVVLGGYLWLQGRSARLEAGQHQVRTTNGRAADTWTQRLGKFLRAGPTNGTWQTRSRSCIYTSFIAPHPTEAEFFIVAQVDAAGVRKPLVVSRWLIPRHFFRAPAYLFFSNYVRTEGPVREELEDGTKTWCVHWGPRYDEGGMSETERLAWFTESSGEVVQIEDRSRTGHMIRRVTRVSHTTGAWDLKDLDLQGLERCVSEPPDPASDPEQGLRQAGVQAPFDVYRPYYLPPGFVLVRSSYGVCDASLMPGAEEIEDRDPPAQTPVQLVSQLYSDGLAMISVGVAPKEDMNVIEALTAGMAETDDPAACPGLPADTRDLEQNGSVIRMRTDTCRIVLRRDDLPRISVTIIGRNELPTEEYLRMIGSLERVEAETR
jgi:hypothetical protein